MKSRNRKAINYRMLLGLLVAVLMFCGNVKYGYASNIYDTPQYYANWYKINGMASVMGYIMNGSWTPEEAVTKCIKPAYDAGYVEQKHLEAFCEYYPEAKSICEANGIPVGGTTEPNKPKPTPEPVPAYTIEDCDMYMYATTEVNVRSDASTNAGRVGSIEQNGQAHITGKTSNGWYRLEYNGITGFSVKKYFADKPVEIIEDVTDVPEPTEAPTPEPTQVPTPEPTSVPNDSVVEPTEAPTEMPTEAPTPEPTEKPSDTKTEILTPTTTAEPTVDSTPAPVVDTPVVTEPVEENNFLIPWIALGGVVVVLGVVAVIVLKRKK